jgi:RimJ/RimL family protein N-acetyltransferase
VTIEVPTLTTARLVLRPLVAADAAAYAAMHADPDVTRHLTADGNPLTPEDAWRQLAMLVGHWQLRGFGMWAVAERARPELLVGRLGAHQPEGWPDFEIGWAIARPYWGRGYATEGAGAAMKYAFEVLDRPRVVSLIHPANTRSIAVAERLGERHAGDWTLRGERVELYALERAAWRASRGAA